MPLLFREATESDIPAMIALGLASYGMYTDRLDPDQWDIMRTRLSDRGTYEGLFRTSTGFVCLQNDCLLGMVFLIPSGNPTPVFDASWAYVRLLGVDPGAQGQGIASQLMRRCIDHAVATGERVLALHTSEFMEAAQHIYTMLGFERIREVGPFFNRTYWLYLLSLEQPVSIEAARRGNAAAAVPDMS